MYICIKTIHILTHSLVGALQPSFHIIIKTHLRLVGMKILFFDG